MKTGIAPNAVTGRLNEYLVGAIGIVLFRTSTVQMSVEGKAQVLLDTHNNKSYPDIYTVRLGVMF